MRGLLGHDTSLSVGGYRRRFVVKSYKISCWRSIRDGNGEGSGRYIIKRYHKAAKRIISRALEIGATAIVMEDLKIHKKDLALRSLMGGYIAGHIGDSKIYWSIRQSFTDLT